MVEKSPEFFECPEIEADVEAGILVSFELDERTPASEGHGNDRLPLQWLKGIASDYVSGCSQQAL